MTKRVRSSPGSWRQRFARLNNAAVQQKTACMLHLRSTHFILQKRFGALLSWTFPP
jgi:hypothetical protein